MAQYNNNSTVDPKSGYSPANSTFYSKRRPIPFPANESIDVTTFISSRAHSGKIAFIDATTGRKLSFSDVWNAVESLATSLSVDMSIRKGDVVLLLSPNSIFFPIICLAVPTEVMEDINRNGTTNGGNNNSDDEVVVGEQEELAERKSDVMPSSSSDAFNGADSANGGDFNQQKDKAGVSGDGDFFHFEKSDSDDPFGDRPIPEWVAWGNGSVGGSVNPFEDNGDCSKNLANSGEAVTPSISPTSCSGGESIPNSVSTSPDSNKSSSGSDSSQKAAAPVPSLFEEDVEFVGVELEGTEKAMEHALKEGIVGEAAPLKRSLVPKMPEKDNTDEGGSGVKEFNDANFWRVDQEVTVLE